MFSSGLANAESSLFMLSTSTSTSTSNPCQQPSVKKSLACCYTPQLNQMHVVNSMQASLAQLLYSGRAGPWMTMIPPPRQSLLPARFSGPRQNLSSVSLPQRQLRHTSSLCPSPQSLDPVIILSSCHTLILFFSLSFLFINPSPSSSRETPTRTTQHQTPSCLAPCKCFLIYNPSIINLFAAVTPPPRPKV